MVAIIAPLASCAGFAAAFAKPGGAVPGSAAQRYCPSDGTLSRLQDHYAGQVSGGRYLLPRVGDNACQVLAKVGEPYDRTQIEVSGIRAENWFYRAVGSYDVHLVSLELDGGEWVVDGVSW